MKFEDLSKEDQALLNTEFPEEIEKQAAAEVALAQDLYASGFAKLAAESADAMDKAEKEEEEEEEKKPENKLDEGEKKEAMTRGAFIAKGYIDGLKKLGSDRHQDENHYLYSFVAEKLAAAGMDAGRVASFLSKMKSKAGAGASAAKGMASKGKDKAMAGAQKMKGYLKEHRGKAGLAAGAAGGVAAGRASKGD